MATTSTILSPRITELLRTEHRVSQTKLGSLGPKDLADLRSVASGRSLPDQRVKALALLAATGSPGSTSASVWQRAAQRPGRPQRQPRGACGWCHLVVTQPHQRCGYRLAGQPGGGG